MRLGFVSARAGYFEGGLWADAGLGRLVAALRDRASAFTCALVQLPERHALLDHFAELEADAFLPLPPLPGFIRGFHKVRACRSVIREVERRSDVVIVQMPFIAPLALLGATVPRVYHVYGDVLTMARVYRGVAGGAARAAAHGIEQVQRRLFRQPQSAVVTHGEAMLRRYAPGRGRAVVSSSLYAREVGSIRRQRPEGAPFRVLYAGYLRPEKGIDTLLAAFEQVLDEVPEAELHIVGPEVPRKEAVADALFEVMERLQERATVRFLGHQPYGPALFHCFADADVLALPSRSEGTPRVLVEARAFGCPVVASRVGGVPTSVDHGVDGLLVPPDDPDALATALLCVAREPALRRQLTEGGYARARRTTLETFAAALYAEAKALHATHSVRRDSELIAT